jgi:hypothetical protein
LLIIELFILNPPKLIHRLVSAFPGKAFFCNALFFRQNPFRCHKQFPVLFAAEERRLFHRLPDAGQCRFADAEGIESFGHELFVRHHALPLKDVFNAQCDRPVVVLRGRDGFLNGRRGTGGLIERLPFPRVALLVSYQVEASQQAAFYNRYLDAMDAKVQAKYLRRALDKGEPPDDTDGLYCPLSKAFKGEYRQRVARVVAGGPFDASVADAVAEKPQTRPQFATAQSSRPEPASSVPSQQADLKAAFQDAKATAAETLSRILRSKRIIRLTVIGLILVALVAVSIPVFRFIQSQSSKSAIPPVAVAEQTQPPRANPATPPPTAPHLQNHA